jgi:hypothetical protein
MLDVRALICKVGILELRTPFRTSKASLMFFEFRTDRMSPEFNALNSELIAAHDCMEGIQRVMKSFANTPLCHSTPTLKAQMGQDQCVERIDTVPSQLNF